MSYTVTRPRHRRVHPRPHELGFLDDLLREGTKVITDIGKDVTKETQRSVEERSSKAIDDALRSTDFARVLQAVEAAAEAGVTKKVQEHAIDLALIAVAAGGLGGVVMGKMGTMGAVVGIGLGVYGAVRIAGAPR